ncbi:hypothetical protein IFM89_029517 [Coptis chinensis]|uniref:long-chain-alcohol oxidase n=1 Tax=Coptis chinensis TaxID=261450 RepID=A0A835HYW6_9MAGN|nr:hypothetical protein IFM89_029517 [Coptis chinensis]
MKGEERMRREPHPLLRGGRTEKSYDHGLSSYELISLASICEAFIPPIPLDSLHVNDGKYDPPNKSLEYFFLSSGSDDSVPDEVAERMVKACLPEAVFLVRWTLRFLSTRLGTLFLCGFICLGGDFPFIKKYSDMSLENREKVLQKWSKEKELRIFRVVFVMLKILCLFTFFSRTDKNMHNPAWDAIGYHVDRDENSSTPKKDRPLEKGIIETIHESDSTLVKSLSQKGVSVINDPNKNFYRIECDVVIVGSGSGGGVAAAVLAASGKKVVVLEKGNYFVPEDYSSLEGPSMNQLYESSGMLATGDAKCTIIAGSTVGGGSAVNWPQRKTYEGGIITSLHKVVSKESGVQAIIETPALGPAGFVALFPWVSGYDMKERLVKYARTVHLFALVRDQGSGEVMKECKIRYRLNDRDKENLRTGLRQALRILIAAGAVEVGTHRNDGQRLKCKGIKEKELEEFLDRVTAHGGPMSKGENWNIYASAHQMGSCRMGATEEEGAVDENGESWEVESLFVCDGSLLPSAVGINPMITIQSTAYCLSKKIAESCTN